MGTTSWVVYACAVVAVGCGAGQTRIDPGDLELRDLLGVAPEVAVRWDAAQRAAARRVLGDGLHEPGAPRTLAIADGTTIDDRVTRTLAALDALRAAEGEGALGVVRLSIGARAVIEVAREGATAAMLEHGGVGRTGELWLDDAWDRHAWGYLPGRGLEVLSAIAADAGHVAGPVIIAPSARMTAIAGYVAATEAAPARLVVNPILLAALEPDPGEAAAVAGLERPAGGAPSQIAILGSPRAVAAGAPPRADGAPPAVPVAAGGGAEGNPYSFYGSVAECAFAQRTRCEACVAAGDCSAVTDTSDGNGECTRLGEGDGRGYFLLCINLALAISSVDDCAASAAPSCARSTSAAGSLATLEANADFLDDPACGGPLDGCLARIYGAPSGEFPGVDGGTTVPDRPRETTVNCGDSCSNNNSNNTCTGPDVDCTGPSCNNSFSCDSACSSSNDQSGCGGNCDACNSDGGGGGGGGGGSCSNDSSSSSSSCGSGDGCGGDGCGGDGCSGDGCGGDGCSGDGDKCGSSGGGNSCSVARRDASPRAALVISMVWAFLPVPVAAAVRRRSRKRRRPPGDRGGGPEGDAALAPSACSPEGGPEGDAALAPGATLAASGASASSPGHGEDAP